MKKYMIGAFVLVCMASLGAMRAFASENSSETSSSWIIVSSNGEGAPNTVLRAEDQDIKPFLKVDGYTADGEPIINSQDDTTSDANKEDGGKK